MQFEKLNFIESVAKQKVAKIIFSAWFYSKTDLLNCRQEYNFKQKINISV